MEQDRFQVVEWQGRYNVREVLASSTTIYCDRVVSEFSTYQEASDYAYACDQAGRDL
jgi:hypothetical protein